LWRLAGEQGPRRSALPIAVESSRGSDDSCRAPALSRRGLRRVGSRAGRGSRVGPVPSWRGRRRAFARHLRERLRRRIDLLEVGGRACGCATGSALRPRELWAGAHLGAGGPGGRSDHPRGADRAALPAGGDGDVRRRRLRRAVGPDRRRRRGDDRAGVEDGSASRHRAFGGFRRRAHGDARRNDRLLVGDDFALKGPGPWSGRHRRPRRATCVALEVPADSWARRGGLPLLSAVSASPSGRAACRRARCAARPGRARRRRRRGRPGRGRRTGCR